MLTSEEFTERVFGASSPRADDPEFRKQAVGYGVRYQWLPPRTNRIATYSARIVLPENLSIAPSVFTLFTVTTQEEGYEEELVKATQEFVARLSSLEELRHLAQLLSFRRIILESEALPALWSGDDLKEGYSPLERLLLAGHKVSFLDTPLGWKGVKHLLSPQEALSHLPEKFVFPVPSSRRISLLEALISPPERELPHQISHRGIDRIALMGTATTKTALEEVAAFASVHQKDSENRDVLLSLIGVTPWHPEQRPEGMTYADLFQEEGMPSLGFLLCLGENYYEEDYYLGLRWLQKHWSLLPPGEWRGVRRLVEEWASFTVERPSLDHLVLGSEAQRPAAVLLLQALLPHRSEFTEEERYLLLTQLFAHDPEGSRVLLAVKPTHHRLLSLLMEALGPLRLARLFLAWPEGEVNLYRMEEGKALAAHPEWWDLPPTWWLPLLREEILEEEVTA